MKSMLILIIFIFLNQLVFAANILGIADRFDSRTEYYQLDKRKQMYLGATVKLIDKSNFDFGENRIKTERLTKVVENKLGSPLCPGERFSEQPSVGGCSGFLVASNIIVTAGHCIQGQSQCRNKLILFNYKYKSKFQNGDVQFEKSDIYSCQEILHHAWDGREEKDFAILKLDREVKGVSPLKLGKTEELTDEVELAVLGYPNGIPAKYAGRGRLWRVFENFFQAYIDTFGGNSGSPVIDANTGRVYGVVSHGGDRDYVRDPITKSCYVVNSPRFSSPTVVSSSDNFLSFLERIFKRPLR